MAAQIGEFSFILAAMGVSLGVLSEDGRSLLLGAALMEAGQPGEAEKVYREDLRQNPANGWALYGLSAALKAQGKNKEAQQFARQFAIAWQHADVMLTESAF